MDITELIAVIFFLWLLLSEGNKPSKPKGKK